MSIGETTCEQPETISDTELILRKLDHLDEQLHEIRQFIDDHRPFLARFTKSPVLGYLKAGKRG